MAQKKKRKILRIVPKKSGQIPATKNHLDLAVRSLSKKITSQSLVTKAGFKKADARMSRIEARFKDVDARFDRVEARFKDVDSRFDRIEAQIEDLRSLVYKVLAVVEEQNARNKFVLDGYSSLDLRLRRLEDNL